MSNKPIFVATHPRACSTAFERVFMTRRDSLQCVHEPFGDAFYYGPERLSSRYELDEKSRVESGFSNSTFQTILDRFEREGAEGKRLFIKDITHYLVPPNGKPVSIAPSCSRVERGVGTVGASTNGASNGITSNVKFSIGTESNGDLNSTSDGNTNREAHGTNGVVSGHTNGHTNGGTNLYANGFRDGYTEGGTHGQTNGHPNGNSCAPYPYNTDAEPGNPTVIPRELLEKFHFTFLIRHPRSSIPSYYRCTIPPLNDLTGFDDFMPSEAGYDELRRVFDYLRSVGQIGPQVAGQITNEVKTNGIGATNGHQSNRVDICVVDADDLLDNPHGIIEAYCKSVGMEYDPRMLTWDTEVDHQQARDAFEKWNGFHEDAMDSSELRPRTHKKKYKSEQEEDTEWRKKFGEKGAKTVRDTVNANIEDYEYLKQFALKI